MNTFRTILLGAAVTLAAAAPSLAQSYDSSVGTGNIVPWPHPAAQTAAAQSAWSSYARVVPRVTRTDGKLYARMGAWASTPASSAFNRQDGFPGDDPDPNIQFQLHRESLQGRW
jgi:hypothetical protein